MRSTKERCVTCGRPVPAGAGTRDCYDGELRTFCSAPCQARFECDPARYVGEPTCLDCPLGYT